MTVAVIGAGLAGLAAARELAKSGVEAVVFEKSNAIGGRCSTRRVEDFVFDSGATSIAGEGTSLDKVMLEELSQDELVIVPKPIYLHSGLHPTPSDPRRAKRRHCYRSGMNVLPKLLAANLNIKLRATVASLTDIDGKILVRHSDGEEQSFDRVILTAPVPQTTQLLWTLGESRALGSVRYRPCLSVMLGFRMPPPPTNYHALLDPDQRHPLTWLSIEQTKCPGRGPEGGTAFVAQMSPAYSLDAYSRSDESIETDVLGYLARLYGEPWRLPAVRSVKRWKYSQPEIVARFESANRGDSKVIVAGDGVQGPRLEMAYETGVQAAKMALGVA